MAAISKPIEAVMAAGHRRQSANATIVSSPQILVVSHARPPRVDDDAAIATAFRFPRRAGRPRQWHNMIFCQYVKI
jgi:hypothetical protein